MPVQYIACRWQLGGIHETVYPCDATVNSSVLNDTGRVLSRYGDDRWELWPHFQQSDISPSAEKIDWRPIPPWLRAECKAVTCRYWTEGLPGMRRPVVCSVLHLVQKLRMFANYLATAGISSWPELSPIHLAGFMHQRSAVDRVKAVTPTIELTTIEILHRFRTPAGLTFTPRRQRGNCLPNFSRLQKNETKTHHGNPARTDLIRNNFPLALF